MRRYLWIVVVIIVALAAGWWLGRGTAPSRGSMAAANTDSGNPNTNARPNAPKRTTAHAQSTAPPNPASVSKPLPPPGTPLKQTFDELKARADAGDTEAASRLYQDMQKCQRFRMLSRVAPAMVKRALDEKISGVSAEKLKQTDEMLGWAQTNLSFVRDNSALCSSLDSSMFDSFLPTALRAAQLGDLAATNCYVNGGGAFGVPPGLVDHPEWLVEYKQNVLPMANTAIEKGDWTMVSQLAWAYRNHDMPTLLGQVTGDDSAMAYRYLKLSLLGAPGADKDKSVSYLEGQLSSLAEQLSTEQRRDADAWAQNAYQRYFSANPKNTVFNSFSPCGPNS